METDAEKIHQSKIDQQIFEAYLFEHPDQDKTPKVYSPPEPCHKRWLREMCEKSDYPKYEPTEEEIRIMNTPTEFEIEVENEMTEEQKIDHKRGKEFRHLIKGKSKKIIPNIYEIKESPRDDLEKRKVEYEHILKNGKVQVTKHILKKAPITPEDILDMKQMLREGYFKKYICQKYKITYPTLNKYLAL